jgi:hypothetical protein
MGAGLACAETGAMLSRKRLLLAAATACAALAIPPVASAEDFCVGAPAGCTGTPVAANGLKAALTGAQSNGSDDRFFLAAGVFSADGFSHKSPERVEISGTSAGNTTLRSTLADDAVLWLEGNPASSVSSLTVEATGGMTAGLMLQGAHAQRVTVGVNGAGFSGYGAALLGGASFDDGRVDLGSSNGFAVAVLNGAVTGSTLNATNGVGVGAFGGAATVRRSTLSAGLGAVADGSRLAITDSVIDAAQIGVGAFPGFGLVGTTATVDLARMTIVGGGKVGVFADADEAGEHATVHMRDSVINNNDTPVARSATNGATTANVTTERSLYPVATQPINVGPGHITETGHLTVNPGLVDEAGGDFHLAAGSPLIDAGTPGDLPAGAVDRDGRARASDGDGDCAHVSDIGAFEYQGSNARAVATAAAATAGVGQAVGFSAAGSCIPGPEAPTVGWSFDDGATATGAAVTHAFQTPGRHSATVTVTDGHGHSAQATAGVDVTAPAAAAAAAPSLGRLRVAPTRVQIGTRLPKPVRRAVERPLATIGFRLSTRATVTLRFAKLTSSGKARPVKTKVRINARKGRNRIRFAARLTRRMALAPGNYRLTAVATDTAGARSKPAKTRFTAVKPTQR